MAGRQAVWRCRPHIEPNYSCLERRQAMYSGSALHSRVGAVIIRDNRSCERQLSVRLSTLDDQRTKAVCAQLWPLSFLPRDALYCKARSWHHRMSSVCLSVCLSVTLVDCDHIGWNYSKIISRLISVGFGLHVSADPMQHGGSTPKRTTQSGRIDVFEGDNLLFAYLTISGKSECGSYQRGQGSDVPQTHPRRSKQNNVYSNFKRIGYVVCFLGRIAQSSLRYYNFLVVLNTAAYVSSWLLPPL